MDEQYLTPHEVSARYKGQISIKTLANWRVKKIGPTWTKIGGRILYRLDHILAWEKGRTAASMLIVSAGALPGKLSPLLNAPMFV